MLWEYWEISENKHTHMLGHDIFFCGLVPKKLQRLPGCFLWLGPMTQQPPELRVYNFSVCFHIPVWEKKQWRKCHHTPPPPLLPPSSLQEAPIKAVWRLSLTRCRMLWQPSVSVVRGELDLWPLLVCGKHGPPGSVMTELAVITGPWFGWRIYWSLWRTVWLKMNEASVFVLWNCVN